MDLLLGLAEHATVPVINGLTDRSHPCQLMADVMTYEEHKGDIAGSTLAWVGDGNNVAVSLIEAAKQFGFHVRVGTPPELAPPAETVAWAGDATVSLTHSAEEAVAGADAVFADTWVSMGDEDAANRHNLLAPFQVNDRLMESGRQGCDLPALPARAPRGGSHQQRHGRPAVGRLRRGGKPPARAEGRSGLVHGRAVLRR